MTKLQWDRSGERLFETGVSRGVLYVRDNTGLYPKGVAWNGLTTVTESPSGAEANPQYADNIKYLNLRSAEEAAGTIEAFMYPDEFAACDGSAEIAPGVSVGQQNRSPFGFSYQSKIGNDIQGQDFGYKINIVYGATASPSEKAHETVNDSPEATALSWEYDSDPVEVPGLKPSATLTINSTKIPADKLKQIEDILYGTAGVDARLPLPAEIITILQGGAVEVEPQKPAYNASTKALTIPAQTGVVFSINGDVVPAGTITLTEDTVVDAKPAAGYTFPEVTDDDWLYEV
jgi:hypothetical protein